MFVPNNTCTIQASEGLSDIYGQPRPGVFIKERCAVIRLVVMNVKSAVRADSSASRGSALELEAKSKFLLTAKTRASVDDLITIAGSTLRIMTKEPRFDLTGQLDHYEVTATFWGKQ